MTSNQIHVTPSDEQEGLRQEEPGNALRDQRMLGAESPAKVLRKRISRFGLACVLDQHALTEPDLTRWTGNDW